MTIFKEVPDALVDNLKAHHTFIIFDSDDKAQWKLYSVTCRLKFQLFNETTT